MDSRQRLPTAPAAEFPHLSAEREPARLYAGVAPVCRLDSGALDPGSSRRSASSDKGVAMEIWAYCDDCSRWFYCPEWFNRTKPQPVCPGCHREPQAIENRARVGF